MSESGRTYFQPSFVRMSYPYNPDEFIGKSGGLPLQYGFQSKRESEHTAANIRHVSRQTPTLLLSSTSLIMAPISENLLGA